jgi:hypothetical protein
MNTITYHIVIEEETDASFRFTYTNASTGLPMDLTGYRAEMQVRSGYSGDSVAPVLTYTTENGGGIILGGTAGTVDIFIAYTDTEDMQWNMGKYTLYLINPNSGRIPFVKGFFTINKTTTLLRDTNLPNTSNSSSPHPNNLGLGGTDGNG